MSSRNTGLRAILAVVAIVLSVAFGLIAYMHFSNKEEARIFLSQGKKEIITISEKQANKRFSKSTSGRPRFRNTYLLSGSINTADNSKFGAVDPNCKVDVAKGQFCTADFSAGFKINLSRIQMVVTREMYDELEEGDKIEVYCMKIDGKDACKPSKILNSYFN
jgi:hypothetical protein